MFGPLGLLGLARQTEAGCVAGTGTYTDLTGAWLDDWWQAQVGNRAGSGTTSRTILLQDCTAPGCWLGDTGRTFSFPFRLDHAAGALRVTLNYALRTDASGCDEAGRSACPASRPATSPMPCTQIETLTRSFRYANETGRIL